MVHPQQSTHQPGYSSWPQSTNTYSSRPLAAPSNLPAPGFPPNMPQQDHTGYYPQQVSQQHRTYPQSAAVHRYPPNSEYNNTNYHPPTNIPNHPPPAYDALYSPDEDSLEQAEPVTSEQVHDAEAFVDEETLGWIPSPKNNRQQTRRLEKPVVIPRIGVTSRLKAPLRFLRAYSPILATHDIHEKDFLAFIDNLCVAQAGSPVFTAMDAAGQGVGFVPWHWAALTGAGIQVAAGVGSSAVAIIRTKRFLATANEQYFAPRGLKVSLKKDDDLVNCLFADPGSAQASEYRKRLLAPVDMENGQIELRQRKMAVLRPHIAPLTEHVLPPEKQGNILDKIAARGLEKKTKNTEKRLAKRQRKAQKRQAKIERLRARGMIGDDGYDARKVVHDDSSSSSFSSDSGSSDSEMERMGRRVEKMRLDPEMSDKKRAKHQAKIEEDRQKYQRKFEKKVAKANRRADKANEKAEKNIKRMEYIVIENL
ncbi:hypothetical protein TCE0_011f00451 [Talaromyces pinophilus]|uniref:Uncharacterized protein n=1 Tax=Talaromyces pinophilus TaxID=128442 RepID=A0A0B8MXX2_TALPI|nr:hypothetical protein TCE0_011f00451 [Talaromyces pinophilus]